jgi:hypothetical protein
MGEHYVAVSFDKLKWVNEAVGIAPGNVEIGGAALLALSR